MNCSLSSTMSAILTEPTLFYSLVLCIPLSIVRHSKTLGFKYLIVKIALNKEGVVLCQQSRQKRGDTECRVDPHTL